MCGICGIINTGDSAPISAQEIALMLAAMTHRGPDGEGIYLNRGVGIGNRRLAIIDLERGDQPIFNEDKSIAVVHNGEIYNYKELRRELESLGHKFYTNSDTEILAHLYEERGYDMLSQLNGIFAFALYDLNRKILLIARDRAGIKPLYYYQSKRRFIFASEIKPLLALPEVPRRPDYQAIDALLSFGWIPEPRTGFEGIQRLSAGSYMLIEENRLPKSKFYWDFKPQRPKFSREEEAAEELKSLLEEAVKSQMVSDVPVGALLSGGLDSSALAIMAEKSGAKVPHEYYSAYWSQEEARQDFQEQDILYARRLAKKRGFNLREVEISSNKILRQDFSEVARIAWAMEQPCGVPAILPAFFISRAAKNRSKVLLSGTGPDELFAGYPRHLAMKTIPYFNMLPPKLKSGLTPLLDRLPIERAGALRPALRKLKRAVPYLEEGFHSRYIGLFKQIIDERKNMLYSPQMAREIGGSDAGAPFYSAFYRDVFHDELNSLLYVDFKVYLPGDSLLYSDKMGMANSVEIRTPFLDNRIIDFAASLPPSFKLGFPRGKRIFRRAVSSILPLEILRRKKAGFTAPVNAWLKSDQGAIPRSLIQGDLNKRELFNPSKLSEIIQSHISGRDDYSVFLWTLIMLEIWFKLFFDAPQNSAAEPNFEDFSSL